MNRTSNQARLLLALGLFAFGASAAEIDNAPAATCVAISGGSVTPLSGGGIENAGSQTLTVLCPANRKTVGGVFTSSISGTIYARDNNSSANGNVCCRAMSSTLQGNETCSSGVTPDQALSQIAVSELVDATTTSHFFFSCKIPPVNSGNNKRSALYSFRTVQQ